MEYDNWIDRNQLVYYVHGHIHAGYKYMYKYSTCIIQVCINDLLLLNVDCQMKCYCFTTAIVTV